MSDIKICRYLIKNTGKYLVCVEGSEQQKVCKEHPHLFERDDINEEEDDYSFKERVKEIRKGIKFLPDEGPVVTTEVYRRKKEELRLKKNAIDSIRRIEKLNMEAAHAKSTEGISSALRDKNETKKEDKNENMALEDVVRLLEDLFDPSSQGLREVSRQKEGLLAEAYHINPVQDIVLINKEIYDSGVNKIETTLLEYLCKYENHKNVIKKIYKSEEILNEIKNKIFIKEHKNGNFSVQMTVQSFVNLNTILYYIDIPREEHVLFRRLRSREDTSN